MKRILLAGATVLALTAAQPTLAADAPIYKGPAPYAVALFNWTGFYVGATVGYGWGDSKHCDANTCALPGVVYPAFTMTGWTAGGTIGYNNQIGNVVLGVEADYSWANITGSSPSTLGFGCAGRCLTQIQGFGTVRARLGYAFDRFLPYITGGVAFTQLNASIGNPILANGSATTTRTNLTLGAGVEYAFTNNWSAKLEYLHVFDGGDFTYAPTLCAAPGCFARGNSYDVVRAGLNWHF